MVSKFYQLQGLLEGLKSDRAKISEQSIKQTAQLRNARELLASCNESIGRLSSARRFLREEAKIASMLEWNEVCCLLAEAKARIPEIQKSVDEGRRTLEALGSILAGIEEDLKVVEKELSSYGQVLPFKEDDE